MAAELDRIDTASDALGKEHNFNNGVVTRDDDTPPETESDKEARMEKEA